VGHVTFDEKLSELLSCDQREPNPYFWTDGSVGLVLVVHNDDLKDPRSSDTWKRTVTLIVEVDDANWFDGGVDHAEEMGYIPTAYDVVDEETGAVRKPPVPGQRVYAAGTRRLYHAVITISPEAAHDLFYC
jgi:hypothetical protein